MTLATAPEPRAAHGTTAAGSSRLLAAWWRRSREARVAVLWPWLVTRVALLVAGLAAPALVPRAEGSGVWDPTAAPWLNMWTRWDGLEYLLITHEGYSYVPGRESNIAFAPLLPLLMKLGTLVGGGSYDASIATALVVSNGALLVGLWYVYLLARADLGVEAARRAVLYVLVFPTTLFLSAVYPESLFLALTAASFWFARRGRWWRAAALGSLAALARPYGVIAVVPLAFEYLAQRGFQVRRIRRDVLALSVLPLALLGWWGYLYGLTGEPFAAQRALSAWDRRFVPPWETFFNFFQAPLAGHGSLHSPLDLGFALVFLVLVGVTWARVRATLALYATLLYALVLSVGNLVSVPRYGLELFPVFLVLGVSGQHRLFHWSFVALSSVMALRFMAAFAQGYWVA